MSLGRLIALAAIFVALAAAQRYGDLYGRVVDPSEAGIGGAAVTLVNQETGIRRNAVSSADGIYSVGSLPPGLYKITARKDGFRIVVRIGVHVSAASLARADFLLPVGSVEESITVYGNTPLLDRQDASTGSYTERLEIEHVPLNGRGMLTLFELTPGTNVTPATRGEAGQFSATGQRANTNDFTVDGISANNGLAAGGLPAQSTGGTLPALSSFGSLDSLISVDSIQDLRITTSNAAAEFSRLAGAAVAINSRSGSNDLHGATSYRTRNELVNANDFFANQAGIAPLALRLQQFTQTLGGPLRRNHTFFFASYERIALRQPYVWRQPVPSQTTRDSAANWAQPLMVLFPQPTAILLAPGVGEWVGREVRPAGLDSGAIRLDQSFGARVSIFGRYSDSPSNTEYGTLAVNRLDLRYQTLTLGLNARPAASLAVDVRVNESFAKSSSDWPAGCTLEPLASDFLNFAAPCDYLVRFSISGVAQLISGREGDRRQRQFEATQTTSWRYRGNTLSLGGDYRRMVAVRRDQHGALGIIADDVSDLTDKRNLWIARSDQQSGSITLPEYSAWINDEWQISRRVTLNAGLRWTYSPAAQALLDPSTNTPPADIRFGVLRGLWTDRGRNIAPRLGLAVRLSSSGDTVLRAGAGLFYESSLSIAHDVLNGGPLSLSAFSTARYAPFPTTLTYGFLPDLKLPRVEEWNVSLEHAFSPQDAVSLAYVGAIGRSLLLREVGGPGSTPTAWFVVTTGHGASDYHALELQYRRRLAHQISAMAAYAWSHSIDNGSGDAYLMWAGSGLIDRGSSDFDLRHSFTGSLTWQLPRLSATTRLARFASAWNLDGIFRARTGFPITVQNSEEYIGINMSNAFRPNWIYGQPLWIADASSPGDRRLNPAAFRPLAGAQQGTLGRNVVPGFGMWQADAALRREVRWREHRSFELRIEAYNLLNHPDFADPVRYLNSPVFGRPTSMLNLMLGSGSPGSGLAPILQSGGPRSFQGSFRFRF
jgi:hypothetical protein